MLVSVFRHRAGVLDLHGAPAGFVVGGFQVHGHAGFHGDVGRVRQERIVDFFRRPDQERKLARFQADGVTEEKVGIIRQPLARTPAIMVS